MQPVPATSLCYSIHDRLTTDKLHNISTPLALSGRGIGQNNCVSNLSLSKDSRTWPKFCVFCWFDLRDKFLLCSRPLHSGCKSKLRWAKPKGRKTWYISRTKSHRSRKSAIDRLHTLLCNTLSFVQFGLFRDFDRMKKGFTRTIRIFQISGIICE